MNTPEAPLQLISSFITDELACPLDPLPLEENLFTSGIVDSIGIMRLITHLEQHLAIKIPPKDLIPDNFRTISTMSAYLESLTGEQD